MIENDPKGSGPLFAAGLIGNRPDTPLSRVATDLGLAHEIRIMCRNPDFYSAFVAAIPDTAHQVAYLTNTSEFLHDRPSDDAFVLFFRRTLPSPNAKPEAHWTSNFVTALNGLRREIPEGPHRFHSVILCATLAEIYAHGPAKRQNLAQSDGELRIADDPFSQSRALFSFKPADERNALESYLRQPDALGAAEILQRVAARRTAANRKLII